MSPSHSNSQLSSNSGARSRVVAKIKEWTDSHCNGRTTIRVTPKRWHEHGVAYLSVEIIAPSSGIKETLDQEDALEDWLRKQCSIESLGYFVIKVRRLYEGDM